MYQGYGVDALDWLDRTLAHNGIDAETGSSVTEPARDAESKGGDAFSAGGGEGDAGGDDFGGIIAKFNLQQIGTMFYLKGKVLQGLCAPVLLSEIGCKPSALS